MSTGREIVVPGRERHRRRQPAAQGRGSRLPRCPPHLNPPAQAEWRRIAKALQRAGVVTGFDRAALAAYCQAWGRWVEAEERLKETPPLVKTPSGYIQQSPWLLIANKQLEIMGRYMVELGLTPAARSRIRNDVGVPVGRVSEEPLQIIRRVVTPEMVARERQGEMTMIEWEAEHCRD